MAMLAGSISRQINSSCSCVPSSVVFPSSSVVVNAPELVRMTMNRLYRQAEGDEEVLCASARCQCKGDGGGTTQDLPATHSENCDESAWREKIPRPLPGQQQLGMCCTSSQAALPCKGA